MTFGSHHFRKNAPAMDLVLSCVDFRVHFVMCTFCKSSPDLRVVREESLEEDLQEAGCDFLQREVSVVSKDGGMIQVDLPRVFEWYSLDFGTGRKDQLRNICPFLRDPERAILEECLLRNGTMKVKIKEFSWEPCFRIASGLDRTLSRHMFGSSSGYNRLSGSSWTDSMEPSSD